jgi:DNA repair protein RecN (Recombination protein N)
VLTELRVENLGIVEELSLTFGPGMNVITGETGAGKTLIVTAVALLVGGRAEPGVVRDGASEARVEGRFVHDGEETVLARVIPVDGRSRAYVDGRLATAAQLAEAGRELVDLHGQHSHQSLLSTTEQRRTLDRFAGADAVAEQQAVQVARDEVRRIDEQLAILGGDPRARAREVDLLRFEISEIEEAGITDVDEDANLADEESLLSEADAHRDALARVHAVLDGTATEAVGAAVSDVADRRPLAELESSLRAIQAQLADVTVEVRHRFESFVVDPERLDVVRTRRARLRELRRKYGESLADVLAFGRDAAARLAELESHDESVRRLDAERAGAEQAAADHAARLTALRRAAAQPFAAAVDLHLHELAMPDASLVVDIEPVATTDEGADAVTFLLAPNAGEPARPLARAASGGELSRTMLAVRVVLSEAPPTLVFDEVDAGVGGEAGSAVGRALATLGRRHQVFVVTHLAQVAAFADVQIVVEKVTAGDRTVATAAPVEGDARVVELSRMLAGERESATAQSHAAELLAAATDARDGR